MNLKHFIPRVFALISFLFYYVSTQSQTLVNQLWDQQLNYPDTVQWSASDLDGGNLITTGNTWHNATQKVNIVTTKTNQSGSVVWQTEYNGAASGFDYGAAVIVDASSNVFVTGATLSSDGYTYDVVVIKYNSSGVQQWATTYNGSGNSNDIPSDILLLGTDIYVSAASIGSSTGYDYVLLKLNSSGTTQWNARYDYASLYDVPGQLATNGTYIVESGASQSSSTNWDYTSLKYNTSGTLLQTQRSAASGYGFDRPTGLVVDVSGNFYLTGYAFNGTDFDMRTIKLDDDLSPVWTVTDDDGDADGSNAICIDNSNNIYIAGFSTSGAGNKLMKIVKYNSSGTQQWEKILQNRSNDIDAEATAITLNSAQSRVIVTGYYEFSSDEKTITTYSLRTDNGNLTNSKDYPHVGESIDVPTGIHASGNFIWVYGRRTVDDTTRYVTIKYETLDYDYDVVDDTSGKAMYIDKEMIISFKPENVDLDFVNNKQMQFANLVDVVDNSTYTAVYNLIKGQGQFTPKVFKIYSHLTANDAFSITRLGDTIPIPKFWSSFIVTLNVDVADVYDTLNNLFSIIDYAHPNYVFGLEFTPDDDAFSVQDCLYDGPSSLEDINALAAWDVEKGGSHVKVGVFDTGIYWRHEDFHLTTGSTDFPDSKIVGGWDFDNEHAVNMDDNAADISNHHGTCVAGIIGAITDNNLGIAGIAGGDWVTGDMNTTGVQLFDMEVAREDYLPVLDEDPLFDTWYCANAITEGAAYTPDGSYGYGLNIMNHSWGTKIAGQIIDWNFDAMSNAMNFAFKSHVIEVCAKGNEASGDVNYPSDLSDLYILSVGGSGEDGEFYEGNPTDGGSNYGHGVDFMASFGTEGVTIYTTDNDETDGYTTFAGTSGSTPIVAGVAALMLSQVNNHDAAPHFENLTQEDVEYILQVTADNRAAAPCSLDPYDDYCGWGIIDAKEALEVLQKPKYKVEHICASYNDAEIDDDDPEVEDEYLFIAEGFTGVAAGYYFADRYKIEHTISYTLPVTTDILHSWILPSMSNTLSPSNPAVNDPFFAMTTPTSSSVDVTGYIYFVKVSIGGATINKWVPFNPNTTNAEFCLSLHTYDEFATDVDEEEETANFTVFPNPTNNNVYISLGKAAAKDYYDISVVDMTGRIVVNKGNIDFTSTQTVSLNDLPPGMYTVIISNDDVFQNAKIIKL